MNIKSGHKIPGTGIKQLEKTAGFPKDVHPHSNIGQSIKMEREAANLIKKMSRKEIELRGQYPKASDEAISKMLKKQEAAEAFKGWKPTVIKGGKDKLATGGIANHFRKR